MRAPLRTVSASSTGTASRRRTTQRRRRFPGISGSDPGPPGLARSCCRRQLRRRHDGAQRARLGAREEGRARSFDQSHREDRPQAGLVRENERREHADGRNAHGIRADHQPLAAPAICCHAGNEREQPERREAHEGDEAGLRRRVGHCEGEQRVRDRRQRCSRARQELPRLEQDEVAISPERCQARRGFQMISQR